MREIKFRAWSFKDKCMYFSSTDHKEYLTFSDMGGMPTWEMYFDSTFRKSYVDDRNGILMQYTGLKDKNGKEIYERDIVKSDIPKDSFIFEIRYMLAEFCLWPIDVKPKVVYLMKECFSIKDGNS